MIWHFYSTDLHEPDGKMQHAAEGVAGFVCSNAQANTRPLYRWYTAAGNGIHFYTVDPNGESAAANGYVFDKIQCYVPDGPGANTLAAYRFYQARSGDHFFTTDPTGELALQGNYVAEGIAFYVFNIGVANTVPLYRWRVMDTRVGGGGNFPGGPIGQQPPTGACPKGSHWDGATCVPDH